MPILTVQVKEFRETTFGQLDGFELQSPSEDVMPYRRVLTASAVYAFEARTELRPELWPLRDEFKIRSPFAKRDVTRAWLQGIDSADPPL